MFIRKLNKSELTNTAEANGGSMDLLVLMDNNTYIDEYYLGEPALSYYIEADGERILFDAGYSDAVLQNAKSMNVDLSRLTKIAISHGHNDHTRGLKYLTERYDCSGITLVSHFSCFEPKYYEGDFIGSPYSAREIEEKFVYKPSNKPVKLSEHLILRQSDRSGFGVLTGRRNQTFF